MGQGRDTDRGQLCRNASLGRQQPRSYCTGVSLKRQEYRLLNTSISRVFTFPVRSTERLFAPIGSVNVVSTEPSEPIGAENASPLLVFTESSLPVSARSKNRFETSASLQVGRGPRFKPRLCPPSLGKRQGRSAYNAQHNEGCGRRTEKASPDSVTPASLTALVGSRPAQHSHL